MIFAKDYNEVSLAISFAVEKHKDHFRTGGKPYITHLARVAGLVSADPTSTTSSIVPGFVVAAAWLHDTVEDVGVSYGELLDNGFADETLKLVNALTKTPEQEADQETGSLRAIKHLATGGYWAVFIKLADRLDNLRDGKRTLGPSYVTKPSRVASTRALLKLAATHRLGAVHGCFLAAELHNELLGGVDG